MSLISEIYDKLNISKASMQELHDYVVSTDIPGSIEDSAQGLAVDVKSKSKVANWRLWLWIMAKASFDVEGLFTAHKKEVTALLAAKQPHHLRWYAEESKKFQFGYALTWIDNQYKYDRDDPNARIIKYAAATEKNGKIILKVAKEVNGAKVPLNSVEKAAFTEFWSQWKDAGVKLEIVSQAADILKINLTIVRDRLVLAGNNSLLRDASVFPITKAIATYAGSLEFDGKIMLSKLEDAIQAAEGVIDVKIGSAQHKPAGGTFQTVDMSVESESGYFVISTESSYNYIDNVIVSIE